MKAKDIAYFYARGPYKAVRNAHTGRWAAVDTTLPWRKREYRFHSEAAAKKRAAEINCHLQYTGSDCVQVAP